MLVPHSGVSRALASGFPTVVSVEHWPVIQALYRRTGFNYGNLIIANCEFSRVRKLLISKLIAHPYARFAQTQY